MSSMQMRERSNWYQCLPWEWVIGVCICALFICFAAMSKGTYQDDDIAHFLLAKFAPRHPQLLFNVWGRPVLTTLYVPVAQISLFYARLLSAILATVTAWLTVLLARQRGVPGHKFTVWVLVAFQPQFFLLAFSVLTELVFAWLLLLALLAFAYKRYKLAVAASAFLPLARYESVVVILVIVVWLILIRKARLVPWLFMPLLLWNTYWAVELKHWQHLLFPFNRALEGPGFTYDYGTGSLFHYPQLLPEAIGSIVLVLFLIGFIHRLMQRIELSHLVMVTLFSLYVVGYWQAPGIGMAGYTRHLVTLSPIFGVYAAEGLAVLSGRRKYRHGDIVTLFVLGGAGVLFYVVDQRTAALLCWGGVAASLLVQVLAHCCPDVRTHIGRGVTLVAVLAVVLTTLSVVRPFELTLEQLAVQEAVDWYRATGADQRLTLGAHVWFTYLNGLDPYETQRYRALTPESLEEAPEGAIVVWDSHYAHRLNYGVPLSMLIDSGCYALLQDFGSGGFHLHIFEKKGMCN